MPRLEAVGPKKIWSIMQTGFDATLLAKLSSKED